MTTVGDEDRHFVAGRLSDAQLVERARSGDRRALGELVARHQLSVRALAVSIVNDATEAEDLSQEAFLRAFGNLDLLVDAAKFGPWLRRITFGVCVDWVRAFRPQLFRLDRSDDERATAETPAPALSPLDRVERIDLVERVMRAIAELPPHYRAPLTLYHIDGLSHDKVARSLGVAPSTVRSLVARARAKLALRLSETDGERERARVEDGDVLAEAPVAPAMLHVLNGDTTRHVIEQSDIPGHFTVWADVLHEGPVPADASDEEFRATRTRFLAGMGDFVPPAEGAAMYRGWDERLATYRDHDEVVLWFEHDLFDQLILIRHLDWFARRGLGRTQLSLICIGEFPGVEGFTGLGELTADQLASLLATRERVTVRQTELARAAWRAFTSDDPTSIERILARDTSALPFLAGALIRCLEEYPAVDSGLPRTERQILDGLARGITSPVALFGDSQRREERVFMGDATFYTRLAGLARGPTPLITPVDAPIDGALPTKPIALTDAGHRVLAGDADWIALDGIDRWIGGVHLVGRDIRWRWDPRERRLVDRRA